jgi:hypothetical protein
MNAGRQLIWIEEDRFNGWGCSECAWAFNPTDPPTGKSLGEVMQNFEERRDNEFASHVCAEHTRTKSTKR